MMRPRAPLWPRSAVRLITVQSKGRKGEILKCCCTIFNFIRWYRIVCYNQCVDHVV